MRVYWSKERRWRIGRCACGYPCGHYRFGPLIIHDYRWAK